LPMIVLGYGIARSQLLHRTALGRADTQPNTTEGEDC
jgi:hypothetical protein